MLVTSQPLTFLEYEDCNIKLVVSRCFGSHFDLVYYVTHVLGGSDSDFLMHLCCLIPEKSFSLLNKVYYSCRSFVRNFKLLNIISSLICTNWSWERKCFDIVIYMWIYCVKFHIFACIEGNVQVWYPEIANWWETEHILN